MHETTLLLIEVGALLLGMSLLGRLALAFGISPIPFYLVLGLEYTATEQAHAEKQRADFDEEQRGLVHAGRLSRGRWRGAWLLRRVLHEFRRPR